MVNVDHGIFPACTEEVREDIGLDNTAIGFMGSIVYLGIVFGSLVAIPVLNYCNVKFVISVCLLFNAASLFLFTLTTNYYMFLLSRFMVGFFQVFFCIYVPVWIAGLFANSPKKKTLMFTLITLGVPLGVIIGYILTTILLNYFNWRSAFYL